MGCPAPPSGHGDIWPSRDTGMHKALWISHPSQSMGNLLQPQARAPELRKALTLLGCSQLLALCRLSWVLDP